MQHDDSNSVSFHMPGHKGSEIFNEFGYGEIIDRLVDLDVTEIPGADNLFQPETVIKSIMDRYSDFYGAKSFLSIGGSSAGLIASILAAVSQLSLMRSDDVSPDLTPDLIPIVIMGRNCHKSIYNAVKLAGARPVYVNPEILEVSGIAGEITPESIEKAIVKTIENTREKAIENTIENPVEAAIAAVVVTSPNYYGVMSDIKGISEICHKYNIPLIVDQAHGAHLMLFSRFSASNLAGNTEDSPAKSVPLYDDNPAKSIPLPAEKCGADIVVNSIHKTLASLTQTAIVNLCSDMVDVDILADKLQIIQSSSPSYILMSSLEINIDLMENHGEELAHRWMENLNYFYDSASGIPGLNMLSDSGENPLLDRYGILYRKANFDRTKLLFNMSSLGITGDELFAMLLQRGIIPELNDSQNVMAMTGIGNVREDYDRLLDALKDIREKLGIMRASDVPMQLGNTAKQRNLYEDLQESIIISSLVGQKAKRAIIPYPPGIPLIAEGEIITEEELKEAIRLRKAGHKVLGLDI